jgi:hypothetical protein
MKMMLVKFSSGRTCNITRDDEKISQVLSDLRVLQNASRNSGLFQFFRKERNGCHTVVMRQVGTSKQFLCWYKLSNRPAAKA